MSANSPEELRPDFYTPDDFSEKYGYWKNHPYFPVTDWKNEVIDNNTKQSYWGWVESLITEQREDAQKIKYELLPLEINNTGWCAEALELLKARLSKGE